MSERYLVAGPLRLDLQDARLSLHGAPVRLGPRAFHLLTVLMQRPEILLTKDELFARVWAGVTVSDAVLTTAMKELRQAIGDNARQPRFIETAHGRGYRFLLPVVRTDAPDAVAPRRRRASWVGRAGLMVGGLLVAVVVALLWLQVDRSGSRAIAGAGAGPHPKSIVVLPFEDLSPEGDQRWFADGLAEEVQATLARTPDLRIVSRLSAARLSRAGAPAREVAGEMAVAQFLEGSVRRSGDRVRVTVKLVRAADGRQLWSHSYDRKARDMISIQEDIAFEIASTLQTVMDPARLRVMTAAGTQSVEAYEAYLLGLAMDQRQLEEGDLAFARQAADAFERARSLDPQFADAHWKAAMTWFGNQTRVNSTARDVPDSVRLTRYLDRVDAAIATSRNEAETLKYQSARAVALLRFQSAHRLMARYLVLRPRDIDAWEEMADLSAYAGERAWMRRAAERIHTLSLEEGNPRSRAITVSVMAMDLDTAVAQARVQLALRPDNALTQYQSHRALIQAGRADEARTLLPRILASRMPEPVRLLAEMRQACAERRVGDAQVLRARIAVDGGLSSRWLAAQLAGDAAGATALLKPLDTPDQLPTLMQFLINPDFDSRNYPLLKAELDRNGVTPPPAASVPHACPTARS